MNMAIEEKRKPIILSIFFNVAFNFFYVNY